MSGLIEAFTTTTTIVSVHRGVVLPEARVIVIAVRYLGALIAQARHARPLADVALKLGARELVQYATIVVGVTFILLSTMEALDAALAGQRVDDVRDLLGGSLWLAAGVTIPTAVGVVALLWQLISSLIGAQPATLSILRALIIARPTPSAASAAGVRRRPRRRKRLTFHARSTHKRGPPGPGGSFARSS